MFFVSESTQVLSPLLAATFYFLLISASSAYQQQEQPEKGPAPEPYSFSYSAQSIGGFSSHEESGDGSGRVTGFYTIQGDDGRERRVDYVADENGYRARVQTNEIGTRSGQSAGAEYQVQPPSAGQLEAAKVSFEQYQQLEEQHANEMARIQSRQSSARNSNQATSSSFRQQQGSGQRSSSSSSSSSSSQFVNRNNSSLLLANSRQSRQPDARDLPPPPPPAVSEQSSSSLDSQPGQQQRATLQTRAAAIQSSNQQARGSAARVGFPRQQLDLQFQQEANQLTSQDYPRQQPAAASGFEQTSQFLIDEPQQPSYLPAPLLPPTRPEPPKPPQRQQPQSQQPQPQQLQPQPQQLQPEPVYFRPQISQFQGGQNVAQVGASVGGEYQQQQDNIINEPFELEVPASGEIPRQPESIFANQQVKYGQPNSTNTIKYTETTGQSNSSRPTAPSGFLSISLNQSDEQSQKTGQEQAGVVAGVNSVVGQTVDYGTQVTSSPVIQSYEVQTSVLEQNSKLDENRPAAIDQLEQQQQQQKQQQQQQQFEQQQQQFEQQQPQQEIPNSVNQIIENISRPTLSAEEPARGGFAGGVVTSRPVAQFVATNQLTGQVTGNKGRQQAQQIPQQQPARFANTIAVRPTLAPIASPTTSFSIIRQTSSSPAPITTTSRSDYAEEVETTTATAQLVYTTTPARFYQPSTSEPIVIIPSTTTTTTTTPAPTTSERPIQSNRTAAITTTTTTIRQPQQVSKQQQLAGVKRGQQNNSPLSAIFRKTKVQNEQQAFLAGNSRPEQVIATARVPLRTSTYQTAAPLAPVPVRDQQQQQQQKQQLQQQQLNNQRFISEAPYSTYTPSEQPASSVSYAGNRNTTTTTTTAAAAAAAASLLANQQALNQLANNNNIRFESAELARRPVSVAGQIGSVGSGKQIYQNLSTTVQSAGGIQQQQQQPQQQQQSWRGIKGGGAKSNNKQFWQQQQQQPQQSAAYANQTGRFQTSSTAAADDYATSLGYGSRVTMPAINLTGSS